jgi:D-alanyl-D-alanine carboxypeptidase (penicillin-binding protein 5/6)
MKLCHRTLVSLALLSSLALTGCGDKSTPTTDANTTANASQSAAPLPPPSIPTPPPPKIPARGYILMDFASGQVLAAENADASLEPASLTKIMTAYAVFDALRSGSLKLTDQVTISPHAWRVGGAGTSGSTSFLPVNSQTEVEVLLRGMIVQSGNDASIALAERVAGSEDAFAHLMNAYAARLGMTNTTFVNSTGLPGESQRTTARDMAILAAAIVRDFPQFYHYYSEKQYTFNGITQSNRNGLLHRDPSVDGLKTGHTESAGYCLVTSAKRDGMRLVSVVMGTASVRAREDASAALLNYGFSFYQPHTVFAANQAQGSMRVWKGAENEVQAIVKNAVVATVPRGRSQDLQARIQLPTSIIAPVDPSKAIGEVVVMLDGNKLVSEPLYAATAIEPAGFFGRGVDSIRMMFE